MKIGKTDFNKSAIQALTFKEFEQLYKDRLKGDLKAIYKELGGKIPKKTVKKEEEDVG